ncbi:MAG: carboxylesterase family protein [Halieaceae bacterium]
MNKFHSALRWVLSCCGIFWVLLCIALHSSASEEPQVKVRDTLFVGQRDSEGVESFRGIPFALPPVGDRRWRRPIPWQGEGGSYDATEFAPACMQTGSGLAWYHGMMRRVGVDPSNMEGPRYSEDCLYLNIWTDLDAEGKRPVLIFIHGGSNTGGWSYEPNYHGESLVRRNVVVVTVAYRLGVFGWLSHPDMEARNLALYDLALSLDWVYQHIADFGGDPNRITVSGESAGATNALHLAISPLSKGRVNQVIHQSGGWPLDDSPDPVEATARGLELASKVLNGQTDLNALRRAPPERVMEAAGAVYADFYFDPIEDPTSLPVTLEAMAKSGNFPALPMMIGTNADERLMYLTADGTLEQLLTTRVGPVQRAQVVSHLSGLDDEWQQRNYLGTGLDFLCPSLELASLIEKNGGQAWVYRFDRVRPGFDPIGAYHGAELPYVFDRHDDWLPSSEVDDHLTELMLDYWTSFITGGQPTSEQGGHWPEWSTAQRTALFNDGVSFTEHPDLKLCRLIRGA